MDMKLIRNLSIHSLKLNKLHHVFLTKKQCILILNGKSFTITVTN
jgi:hypothetical protein